MKGVEQTAPRQSVEKTAFRPGESEPAPCLRADRWGEGGRVPEAPGVQPLRRHPLLSGFGCERGVSKARMNRSVSTYWIAAFRRRVILLIE